MNKKTYKQNEKDKKWMTNRGWLKNVVTFLYEHTVKLNIIKHRRRIWSKNYFCFNWWLLLPQNTQMTLTKEFACYLWSKWEGIFWDTLYCIPGRTGNITEFLRSTTLPCSWVKMNQLLCYRYCKIESGTMVAILKSQAPRKYNFLQRF